MDGRERFLLACGRRKVDRPPLWLMRQAGRVLPEYRRLRKRHDFVTMVRTPDLAVEATLQPIRRFGFDAAVIFSDILVVPEALGQPYRFSDSGGIQLAFAAKSPREIARLDVAPARANLAYLFDAVRMARKELGGRTALLGFCGSPWTLANFMAEGRSAKEYHACRCLYFSRPELFRKLMAKLVEATAVCLDGQIEAGADAVQIFDTFTGLAPAGHWWEMTGRWIRDLVARVKSSVPVILYARGPYPPWKEMARTGVDGLSVDHTVRLSDVRRALPRLVLQGNLDPVLLMTDAKSVRREARRILDDMRGRPGHIFNLGHGVLPESRIACIEALVDVVT